MIIRKQMYRKDIYALANPANRPHERLGQAIVNRYPDYFKSPSELFHMKDEEAREYIKQFFTDNQIPYEQIGQD